MVNIIKQLVRSLLASLVVFGTWSNNRTGIRDIGKLVRDIYEIRNYKITSEEYDIKTIHEQLGIDSNKKPSKEAIDEAFRKLSPRTHPD